MIMGDVGWNFEMDFRCTYIHTYSTRILEGGKNCI